MLISHPLPPKPVRRAQLLHDEKDPCPNLPISIPAAPDQGACVSALAGATQETSKRGCHRVMAGVRPGCDGMAQEVGIEFIAHGVGRAESAEGELGEIKCVTVG